MVRRPDSVTAGKSVIVSHREVKTDTLDWRSFSMVDFPVIVFHTELKRYSWVLDCSVCDGDDDDVSASAKVTPVMFFAKEENRFKNLSAKR